MPLADGVEAQRRLAEGKQFGKIVLTPELPAGRHRRLVGGLHPRAGAATRDRCWVACGQSDGRPAAARDAPRYFRTRPEAEGFIRDQLLGEPGPCCWGSTSASGTRSRPGCPPAARCARAWPR